MRHALVRSNSEAEVHRASPMEGERASLVALVRVLVSVRNHTRLLAPLWLHQKHKSRKGTSGSALSAGVHRENCMRQIATRSKHTTSKIDSILSCLGEQPGTTRLSDCRIGSFTYCATSEDISRPYKDTGVGNGEGSHARTVEPARVSHRPCVGKYGV